MSRDTGTEDLLVTLWGAFVATTDFENDLNDAISFLAEHRHALTPAQRLIIYTFIELWEREVTNVD